MRATVRDGRLTIVPSVNGFFALRLGAATLRHAVPPGVAIVDLSRDPDQKPRELFLNPVAGRPEDVEHAYEVIASWAATLGYVRMWHPTGFLDLHEVPPGGTAHGECPTCGIEWADRTSTFWNIALNVGLLPPSCPACMASIPQWEVAEDLDLTIPGMPATDEDPASLEVEGEVDA